MGMLWQAERPLLVPFAAGYLLLVVLLAICVRIARRQKSGQKKRGRKRPNQPKKEE